MRPATTTIITEIYPSRVGQHWSDTEFLDRLKASLSNGGAVWRYGAVAELGARSEVEAAPLFRDEWLRWARAYSLS